MNRDDIIRMARKAGFPVKKWDDGLDEVMDGDNYHIQTDQVIAFANLVAAAEREACAELCERMARRTDDIRSAALEMAAENIRARGNT